MFLPCLAALPFWSLVRPLEALYSSGKEGTVAQPSSGSQLPKKLYTRALSKCPMVCALDRNLAPGALEHWPDTADIVNEK